MMIPAELASKTVTWGELISFLTEFVAKGGTGRLYGDASGDPDKIREELLDLLSTPAKG